MTRHSTYTDLVRRILSGLTILALLVGARSAFAGVHGRVLDLGENSKWEGRLVPGAKIEFKNQGGAAVSTVTADGNGFYKADLRPGTYFYKVTAPGFRDEDQGRGFELRLTKGYEVYNFSLTKKPSNQANAPPQKPPVLPTKPVATLQGNVQEKTEDGQLVGIPGASIALRPDAKRPRLTQVFASGGHSQSKDAGHYEVVLAAGDWQGTASAPGFETSSAPKSASLKAGETETLDFILTRREAPKDQGIRGTVTIRGKRGETLPKVKLSIVPDARSAGAVSLDSAGKFSRNVTPGIYVVVAEAPGYRTARSGPERVFPHRYTVADLVLVADETPAPTPIPQPGTDVALTGIVNEKITGPPSSHSPLEGATVSVHRKAAPGVASPSIRATSDQDGRATVKGLGEGQYVVTAYKPGFKSGGKIVTLQPGENLINFTLERKETTGEPAPPKPQPAPPEPGPFAGARINLRISERKGRAGWGQVSGAEVRIQRDRTDIGRGQSSPDGDYSSKSLPGGSYTVVVTKPNYEPATARIDLASVDITREIELVPSRSIIPTPYPEPRFLYREIHIRDVSQQDVAVPQADIIVTGANSKVIYWQGKSDENGNAVVAVKQAGDYLVTVTKNFYKPKSQPYQLHPIGPITTIYLDRLRGPFSGEEFATRIIVLDQGGKLLPDAKVYTVSPLDKRTPVMTDLRGNAMLRLPAATYKLKVEKTGYEPSTVTLTVGRQDGTQRVTLVKSETTPDGGSPGTSDLQFNARITVVDQTGKPLPDAKVYTVSPLDKRNRDKRTTVMTDPRGNAVLTLPAATYKLYVEKTGYETSKGTLTVGRRGGTQRVTLVKSEARAGGSDSSTETRRGTRFVPKPKPPEPAPIK